MSLKCIYIYIYISLSLAFGVAILRLVSMWHLSDICVMFLQLKPIQNLFEDLKNDIIKTWSQDPHTLEIQTVMENNRLALDCLSKTRSLPDDLVSDTYFQKFNCFY